MNARDALARWDWRATLLVVGIVRALVLLAMADFDRDPDGYNALAQNLRSTASYSYRLDEIFPQQAPASESIPTAYRPPLYPMVLVVFASPVAIAALHWLLGMATVFLVGWLIAEKISRRWAWLGMLVVGLDPILLNQSTQIMTETFAAFLITACWFVGSCGCETKRGAGFLGVFWGLSTLCRPAFLAVGLLCIAVRWWFGGKRSWRWLAVVLFGLMVCVAPWMLRNAVVFERLSPTTTHGGYTFHLANNAEYYSHLRTKSWWRQWQADSFNQAYQERRWNTWQQAAAVGEVQHWETMCDRREWQLGWTTVQTDPIGFGMATAHRTLKFWAVLPQQREERESTSRMLMRYLVASWYALIFVAAICGLWRLGLHSFYDPWVSGLAIIFGLTVVHSIFWSDLRMRAPLMPIIAVFATAGVTAYSRIKSSTSPSGTSGVFDPVSLKDE